MQTCQTASTHEKTHIVSSEIAKYNIHENVPAYLFSKQAGHEVTLRLIVSVKVFRDPENTQTVGPRQVAPGSKIMQGF